MNAKNITYSPYLSVFQEAIKETPEVDFGKLKEIGEIVKALNHRLRQEMIKIIRQRTLVTVTDLFIALRLDQPVASQHLAVLRKAGIVLTVREGKQIYYSINTKMVKMIARITDQMIGN